MLRLSSQQKGSGKQMHERLMLWTVKFNRLLEGDKGLPQQRSMSFVFDYFVRREVAKKLAEELEAEGDEQVFKVPFTVRG